MSIEGASPDQLESLAVSTLEDTAGQLHRVLVELASRLKPFPTFLGMMSIQAVELEPAFRPTEDRGCVVVCPDGELRQLELSTLPGVAGVSDVEQVEQFRELGLPVEEYIVYASEAIRLLTAELRRRGR